ncbi:hypothetical protein A4G21_16665 [Brucella intermedia]|nr:hypothetical protein A4G21_16665 [Brucella intermedia]
MRILGPIVQALVLAMITERETDLAVGSTIRAELIGDHDAGNGAQTRQQLPNETPRGSSIAAFLDQYFQHKAILINGAPQKVAFTINRHDSLIEMPFVTKTRYAATDCIGIGSSKLFSPLAHFYG